MKDFEDANNAVIKSIDVGAFALSNANPTGSIDMNAYTDQINKIKELRKKNASERIRLDTDLENQVEQARINAMADGIDKEMAQRELNNKIELQAIERDKQEYIRKVTEAQKQIFEAEENAKAAKDKNYKKRRLTLPQSLLIHRCLTACQNIPNRSSPTKRQIIITIFSPSIKTIQRSV